MPKFWTTCVRGGWVALGVLLGLSAFNGVLAVSLADRAEAQTVVIRDIRVSGNRRVEPETVRSYLQFNIGDSYSPAKVDGSIKALFATGLFADVRIARQGNVVLVQVMENPVVNRIAFEGNREVESTTLQTEIQLKPRAVYTRAKVIADVQRILDVYRRQGMYSAHVEPKIIQQGSNRVDVVFEIREGSATKVKSISFIGNRAFTGSQLRDVITTTQTSLLSFLKPTNIYDADRVALDRELLRQFYLKNGYADATVISGNAQLDRDGSGFFITFTIEEGPLYNFGAVSFQSSLRSLDTATLRSALLTTQGTIFNASQIEKTTEKLTLMVAERGYAFARVRPRVQRDAATRTIAVTYAIDEGPRVYIERINVIGNTRTRDYVIRREFRLAEGDAFNPLMVDRAKKRLEALGFFKKVTIKRSHGTAADRVVLSVYVEEQSTGELS
ncbi:MAG: outer membrane protein assembly factor BamA, partial [Hyphomicrobiaceae bacterium]